MDGIGSSYSGGELGAGNLFMSPVTLQMQKHLLSSTLQTNSGGEAARVRLARNGSCSPTPALPYTPTPSPSPLNPLALSINSSLPDLNLSLSGDHKTLNFLQDLKQNVYTSSAVPEGFDDIDVCERMRTPTSKYPYLSTINPMPMGSSVSSGGLSPVTSYSTQMEFNSVLSFAEQSSNLNIPVSSRDNIKGYIVMDANHGARVSNSLPIISTPVQGMDNIRLLGMSEVDKGVKLLPISMTSQIAPSASVEMLSKSANGIRLVSDLDTCNMTTLNPSCSVQFAGLTAIPSITSNGITCITNLPAQVTTQASLPAVNSLSLDCLPSSSSSSGISTGEFAPYSPNIGHQNKKRRLLTFLTEDNNVSLCSTNKVDQSILVNQDQPNKSETYILSSSVPSLVAVSSNTQTLILDPSVVTIATSKPQTIFINSDGTSFVSDGKIPTSSAIFLGSNTESFSGQKADNPGVYLNQRESKNEQTLIINSDGTHATLLTPVTATNQPTLLATQPQNLGPGAGDENLVTGQLLQSSTVGYAPGPTLSFRPVLNTSFTVESLTNNQELDNIAVDSMAVQFPVRNNKDGLLDSFIEKMSVFKCTMCGYIGTTAEIVEIHIIDDHDDKVSGLKFEDEMNWMKVAQRSGIKLDCPMCANLFSSERSFKVHLTEDHLLSECDAISSFIAENAERKKKTLLKIRQEKEKRKEERARLKQHSYEAYVNAEGELRVRSAGLSELPHPNHDEDIDVVGGQHAENGGEEFDLKATEYVDRLLKRRAEPIDATKKEFKSAIAREKSVRIKVGRPKGSRTMGLSKVKRLNPNVTISEQMMGEECRVDNCAVRLKDSVKLELHRSSHLPNGDHQCPECTETFQAWPRCAIHLWREHRLDMELYSCHSCEYRSFTVTVMEKHKRSHLDDKPFLCPDCGRAVKNDKQLKEHMKVVHKVGPDGAHLEQVQTFECDICKQRMGSQREVRYHKERVHERKKPCLCVHCGYAAFSNSSLKLHMRSHTGDKPYACKECLYRTSDHNSLRRHALRHTGEKPYRCPHCPYAAIQSTTYKTHLKKKHPDKSGELFECKGCGYATVQEKLYLVHIAGHKLTDNPDIKDKGLVSK